MNISDPKKFLLVIILLCGWLTPAMSVWPASFQSLEGLPEYGGSVVLDISGDGSTVVGFSDDFTGSTSVRWTLPSSFPQLLFPPRAIDAGGAAQGVSHNGNVVVGQDGDFPSPWPLEAWRWTSVTGRVDLGGDRKRCPGCQW